MTMKQLVQQLKGSTKAQELLAIDNAQRVQDKLKALIALHTTMVAFKKSQTGPQAAEKVIASVDKLLQHSGESEAAAAPTSLLSVDIPRCWLMQRCQADATIVVSRQDWERLPDVVDLTQLKAVCPGVPEPALVDLQTTISIDVLMRYVQALDKKKWSKDTDALKAMTDMLRSMQSVAGKKIADMVDPVLLILSAGIDKLASAELGPAIKTVAEHKATNVFYLSFWNAGLTRPSVNQVLYEKLK